MNKKLWIAPVAIALALMIVLVDVAWGSPTTSCHPFPCDRRVDRVFLASKSVGVVETPPATSTPDMVRVIAAGLLAGIAIIDKKDKHEDSFFAKERSSWGVVKLLPDHKMIFAIDIPINLFH